MTRGWMIIVLLLMSFLAFSSSSLGQSEWEDFGEVGDWKVSGTEGQCRAGFAMKSGLTQFGIGVASKGTDGTFVVLQNIGWSLRPDSGNMIDVEVSLDRSTVFESKGLAIAQVGMIQIFLQLTDMPEADFWAQLQHSESLRVRGRFGGARSVTIDLDNFEDTFPMLRQCAQRLLPAVDLPF